MIPVGAGGIEHRQRLAVQIGELPNERVRCAVVLADQLARRVIELITIEVGVLAVQRQRARILDALMQMVELLIDRERVVLARYGQCAGAVELEVIANEVGA